MISEEKITVAKSRDELRDIMLSSFDGAYYLVQIAYSEPECREKFPEEAARYANERKKINFVNWAVQKHARNISQRFLDVMSDEKVTQEERQLAATRWVIFRRNREARLDKVLEHRYKNMVEYVRNKHLNEPAKDCLKEHIANQS